jgi:hypothetical protein
MYIVEALTPTGIIHRYPAASLRAARFLCELMQKSGVLVEIYGVQ